MSQYLSAETILNATTRRVEDVEVPEWGGTVRVQELSGAERDKIESAMVSTSGKGVNTNALVGFRARLAAASLVDTDGKRLFRTDAEVKRLGEQPAAALQRVCDVAMRLSGLSDEDVEELTGN